MFDVITIGGATRDIFLDIPKVELEKNKNNLEEKFIKVPYGSKLVSENTYYDYGGGSVNTAICLARLGLSVASFCNVGHEGSGNMIVERLKKEGVNTKLVHRDHSLHTGLSILLIGKDSEHTGFLERGANNHLFIDKIRPLKNTRWFYISSLTGSSSEILSDIFNIAEKNNIKVAFNPGASQLNLGYHGLKKYIESTDILILNYNEAHELVFSKTKKKPKNEKDVLLEIEKMGAGISIVTEDGSGSSAIAGGRIYHHKALSTKVADTTGAGDSFGSTFVFGMIKDFDIGYALKIASINAGSVVSKMGATKGLLTYNVIRSSKWL